MTMGKVDRVGESVYAGGPVECSRCRFEFTPVVYEVKEGPGVRVEFVCPDCKKKFTVAHIDSRGLEIRAQLKALGGQKTTASMSAITERVRTIRALKQELKRHARR